MDNMGGGSRNFRGVARRSNSRISSLDLPVDRIPNYQCTRRNTELVSTRYVGELLDSIRPRRVMNVIESEDKGDEGEGV